MATTTTIRAVVGVIIAVIAAGLLTLAPVVPAGSATEPFQVTTTETHPDSGVCTSTQMNGVLSGALFRPVVDLWGAAGVRDAEVSEVGFTLGPAERCGEPGEPATDVTAITADVLVASPECSHPQQQGPEEDGMRESGVYQRCDGRAWVFYLDGYSGERGTHTYSGWRFDVGDSAAVELDDRWCVDVQLFTAVTVGGNMVYGGADPSTDGAACLSLS